MIKQKSKEKIQYLVCLGVLTFLSMHKRVYADAIDCNGDTMTFLRKMFGYIKIGVPVLLILMGSVDFIKAIIAQDDQKMKQAQKDFITRLIIGVAIFFIPSILELLLSLVGIVEGCGME